MKTFVLCSLLLRLGCVFFVSNLFAMSVDFEQSLAPFSNTGEYQFKRYSGSTPSGHTGPSFGARGTKSYIYLETSKGSAHTASDQAVLYLNKFRPKNLSFYYHMFGTDMGTLSVEVYSDGIWYEIFSVSGQQHTSSTEDWKKASFSLQKFVDEVRIRFVGTAAGGYRGDMALDEIVITEREYQVIDFEKGMGQTVNTGDFLFRHHSGKTPSGNTGPNIRRAYYGRSNINCS
ncbi:hypothetical protein [Gayadomonas joobiniege]|uniref:hypothetical protein n=1 Tax=Gayadomonas joobiniege TaxID=1234606 RepID=UPI00035FF37F|nr:hypothetical protein [Gayadomonas joobiniege]